MKHRWIVMAWFFVSLSNPWKYGQFTTIVGPFQTKAQCENIKAFAEANKSIASDCWEATNYDK